MWAILRIFWGVLVRLWAVVGPFLGFAGRAVATVATTFIAAIAGSKLAVTIIFLAICGGVILAVSSLLSAAIDQLLDVSLSSIPSLNIPGAAVVRAYLPVSDLCDFVVFLLSTWASYTIFVSTTFGIRVLASLYSLLTKAFKV